MSNLDEALHVCEVLRRGARSSSENIGKALNTFCKRIGGGTMILKEEKRDLFSVDSKYYLAHCISSDCAMGAGIAVQFQKKFGLRGKLLKHSEDVRKHPTCILEGRVFNLITKEKYWHKPTYNSLNSTLNIMRTIAENNNIKYIAMPKVGSGLDRLQWAKVREMIEDIFDDSDIEILVCRI